MKQIYEKVFVGWPAERPGCWLKHIASERIKDKVMYSPISDAQMAIHNPLRLLLTNHLRKETWK